jgi:hypothetical protein
LCCPLNVHRLLSPTLGAPSTRLLPVTTLHLIPLLISSPLLSPPLVNARTSDTGTGRRASCRSRPAVPRPLSLFAQPNVSRSRFNNGLLPSWARRDDETTHALFWESVTAVLLLSSPSSPVRSSSSTDGGRERAPLLSSSRPLALTESTLLLPLLFLPSLTHEQGQDEMDQDKSNAPEPVKFQWCVLLPFLLFSFLRFRRRPR